MDNLLLSSFHMIYVRFISKLSIKAEKMNHHPTWNNTWNKVDIYLCTHDAGDSITAKDRILAKYIDEVLVKYQLK